MKRESITDSDLKENNLSNLNISEIAHMIRRDWKCPSGAAQPYLSIMSGMDNLNDSYGLDNGRDIVARFVSNASTWRGDTARKVKAELNRRLKSKS